MERDKRKKSSRVGSKFLRCRQVHKIQLRKNSILENLVCINHFAMFFFLHFFLLIRGRRWSEKNFLIMSWQWLILSKRGRHEGGWIWIEGNSQVSFHRAPLSSVLYYFNFVFFKTTFRCFPEDEHEFMNQTRKPPLLSTTSTMMMMMNWWDELIAIIFINFWRD